MTLKTEPSRFFHPFTYLFFLALLGFSVFEISTVRSDARNSVSFPAPGSIVTNPNTTPQSRMINSVFLVPLAVTVKDGSNAPIQNAPVTFTAPGSGPSGTFSNSSTSITILTDASGVASTPFFSNGQVGGPYSVTAATPGLSQVSFSLTNLGGPATHFVITAPPNSVAGSQFNINVVALDQFNNVSSGYTGTLHFTSTDSSPALLPANSTLTNGSDTFTVTLFKAGPQTISAFDTSNPAISGISNSVTVGSAQAFRLAVSAPGTAFRGIDFSFTVSALDGFNNIATGYPGTVHLTTTDGSATMPGDTTLPGGSRTFTTKLFTVGNQTITAADINVSLNATSGNINVFNINTGPKARADFDGDGKTDVSVFRPSEGNWYINRSTAGFMGSHWGMNTDIPVPGDYDGDGKTDLAVFRSNSGDGKAVFYVLNSLDNTFSGYPWGIPGDAPMTGDYDGDGTVDIAIYRKSSNTWWIWNRRNQAVSSFVFGSPGDIPLVMDYDGDGKTDLVFYRPSDHGWYFAQASGNPSLNYTSFQWGLQTDILVPADYDGDKKDDIAVYRPSDGTWYILRTSDGQFMFIRFGASTDIAVPGDYDGDGKNDIAVYRPSSGTWYINGSSSGFMAQVFGANSDLPIPGSYHP